ncbi:MAG: type II toxin-antitoxin system RelE/ParE family toxin [Synergistaceae bacterium]|nr:type II toxin-antitoxin system RelE/ParE family toxin [Synergistaceae bacterium]
MNYSIRYSSEALFELKKLKEYISRNFDSPKAAQNQVNRITKAVSTLAIFPKIHRERRKTPKENGMRIYPIDNYLILYSVDDDERVVNISHVIYGKRDIDSLI